MFKALFKKWGIAIRTNTDPTEPMAPVDPEIRMRELFNDPTHISIGIVVDSNDTYEIDVSSLLSTLQREMRRKRVFGCVTDITTANPKWREYYKIIIQLTPRNEKDVVVRITCAGDDTVDRWDMPPSQVGEYICSRIRAFGDKEVVRVS